MSERSGQPGSGGRLPIVGVMGSGVTEHAARAEPLGRWIAEVGCHLLTGGGGGVMTAVSRAFTSVAGRRGMCIGVLPGGGRPGYPNPCVEISIATHLPSSGAQGTNVGSRNHINVLSSDVVVALPGGAGTSSEVELAVNYGRPVAAFVADSRDIPGLAAGVPTFDELAGVAEFILEHVPALAARGAS